MSQAKCPVHFSRHAAETEEELTAKGGKKYLTPQGRQRLAKEPTGVYIGKLCAKRLILVHDEIGCAGCCLLRHSYLVKAKFLSSVVFSLC